MTGRRIAGSPYMEWSKLQSKARFNLATSGVADFPLGRLPRPEGLEINGPTVYGYAPLQERLSRKTGAPPDAIVAAAGTSMANHLALAGLFEPGEEVLIEQPTYELLVSTAAYLGAEIRRFPRRPERDFALEPAEVERAVTPRTRLIVLTNLHNPSSARTGDDALREIGAIASRAGAAVLVDEVYLEACFDGSRSAFFLGDPFVATSSLTKAYGLSGLRCGWILARPGLARRIWRIHDLYAATPAHPAELLSVLALDHLAEIAADAQARLDRNRGLLHAFLESRADLDAPRPRAGTTSFPRLRSGSVPALCALLREKYETTVVPGDFFEMPDRFRIGIGGDTEDLAEGLRRISAALDELGE